MVLDRGWWCGYLCRSREGSDAFAPIHRTMFGNFNPRSREGSDQEVLRWQRVMHNFNPRSREGSDLVLGYTAVFVDDFNPRSREGSDQPSVDAKLSYAISIHAPAKGATRMYSSPSRWTGISIHAPAKGATRTPVRLCLGRWYFNPRSREGSDRIRLAVL